jgi:Aminoglycoside adenylyltransferase, C-terminal domain
MRGLTPDSQLEEYLGEVVERLARLVGERLLGAWGVGSGALGDFDPQRSDVDVQAVASQRLAREELEALAAELSHPALRCPVRGLEFVLYARAGLTDPLGPAFQLNLNTGPGMRQHEGYDPAAEPRFWFVLDVAIARQQSRALAGAAPAELLPELPRELVLSSLRDALAWWRDHDATGAILAACRAWVWMEQGRWLSKGDAAAWAAERLDDPAPVQRALAHRADAAVPEPTAADVDGVVRTVQGMLPGG